jgi:predicted  nucleic acid-binding Zn-ribbon protein
MPHICTRCNNVFDSGEDILKGCPNCGWKKFMFVNKNKPDQRVQKEMIINRAMGVRKPPKMIDDASPAVVPQIEDRHQGSVKNDGKALESIKITAPGTYELNLPSLFERDELIMAVKEGTYFIDLTSAFKKGKKD